LLFLAVDRATRIHPPRNIKLNHLYGFTAIAAGKKEQRLSTALALVLGLALAFPGPAALAGGPIPGVDVKLGKNPGGSIMFTAPTGKDGTYQFEGLAPGNYDLSVAGERVQTITVGANQSIAGTLTRNDNGTASISVSDINGDGVPEARTFTVTVTPVNDPPGIVAGEAPPPDDVLPSEVNSAFATVSTTRGRVEKPEEPPVGPASEANSALSTVSTTRGTAPRSDGGDIKPGISDIAAAGGLTSYGTAPPPKDSDGKLPGLAGDPILAILIVLKGDPGSVNVSAKTGANGAYRFDKLPAGKYKLSIAGQPPKSVTIGPGGTLNGKVVRDINGNPALLVIAGNIGIGTKSPTSGGVRSTGFGSENPAIGPGSPEEPSSIFPGIPHIPADPGAGSPGGAMDGAGMRP
jgi:hypothetical protein